jgi:regulator of protease activity HflC (stomatin/prohibitin superfamily)
MKRIMAREAEAEREKRGIIIKSEGEIIAAESLAKAAKSFDKSPAAMQLRSLQTLSDISADPSMKLLLFPMEMMNFFNKK